MTTIDELKVKIMTTTAPILTDNDLACAQAEIDRTLEQIHDAKSFDDAQLNLLRLGELQELLATAWFKHKVELSETQKRLVRSFDRSDDPDLRLHVYKEIQDGRFLK